MISDGDSITADVQLICTSPTGENRQIPLSKSSSSNSLSNIFIPDTVGTYALVTLYVAILANSEFHAFIVFFR